MTAKNRENATLSFIKPKDRGSVEETFHPWNLTVEAFLQQGLPEALGRKMSSRFESEELNANVFDQQLEMYFPTEFGEASLQLESFLGFDAVRRVSFSLPFRCLPEQWISEDEKQRIKRNVLGQTIRIDKATGQSEKIKESVCDKSDWERLKAAAKDIMSAYFTVDNMQRAYGPLQVKSIAGEWSVRLNLEGFFWTPREMLGIEEHLYAFYDAPELIQDMNQTILDVYQEKLSVMLKILTVDVVYFMEDLSGKNGPMLSPEMFDEFIGRYYRLLVPVLKENGVQHVFVDTDGDFMKLIPNFINAGIEGFLPLDVNAGMDIVEVRKKYPELKLIGGYNKLSIAAGKNTIDKEFERILPVIRQGGYIPGADHQVAPSTHFEDYQYYISQLRQVMKQAGTDI